MDNTAQLEDEDTQEQSPMDPHSPALPSPGDTDDDLPNEESDQESE